MTKISAKISKIIAAAEALGAPKFSAHMLLAGALAIEAEIDRITVVGEAEAKKVGNIFHVADDVPQQADLAIIWRGAQAVMTFITCPFLSDEAGSYREDDEHNQRIIDAQKVALRYGARKMVEDKPGYYNAEEAFGSMFNADHVLQHDAHCWTLCTVRQIERCLADGFLDRAAKIARELADEKLACIALSKAVDR